MFRVSYLILTFAVAIAGIVLAPVVISIFIAILVVVLVTVICDRCCLKGKEGAYACVYRQTDVHLFLLSLFVSVINYLL